MIWFIVLGTNLVTAVLVHQLCMRKFIGDLKHTKLWPYFMASLNGKLSNFSIEASVHYTYQDEFGRMMVSCGMGEPQWGEAHD